jgi:hypothetical protein
MGEAKLAVYDRLAPRVADEMKEATRRGLFRVAPIGPVGSFVKLGPGEAEGALAGLHAVLTQSPRPTPSWPCCWRQR